MPLMSHSTTLRPLDILFACGREPDYIRNLVLRQALACRHRVITVTDSVRPAAWRYARTLGRAAWGLRRSPDVVLVGFYGQPLMPAMRALTRRPILFDAYLSTYDTVCFDRRWFGPRTLPGRLAYALDAVSCRWADRVLLDTQAHRDYFVQTFGQPQEKFAVVYVGCDEAHFTPRIPACDTERADTFDVFTYTSFLRLHGVEHMLHAAKHLEAQDGITLTIAGAGSRLAEMQRLAGELGLHNVRFPGWVPFGQLPERIARADLCLGGHFSDVAKAGRVIATKTFQFLAMGRPAVVADNAANREVLTHRQDAFLCPPADPAALAAAILELRDDVALRRQLGEAGLALYRRRFTTEAIARDLQAVLDGL
jgi:glycosyltransferase involved in cell wall biosynthesis